MVGTEMRLVGVRSSVGNGSNSSLPVCFQSISATPLQSCILHKKSETKTPVHATQVMDCDLGNIRQFGVRDEEKGDG